MTSRPQLQIVWRMQVSTTFFPSIAFQPTSLTSITRFRLPSISQESRLARAQVITTSAKHLKAYRAYTVWPWVTCCNPFTARMY